MKKILPIALVLTALFSCNKKDKPADPSAYKVDATASKAEWRGEATDHFHVGSFTVMGNLTATPKGEIKEGNFVIPIASIEDYDLQDPIKSVLLDDLKSANFFDIAIHPTASFHITKVESYSGNDTSAVVGANNLVTGEFTMLGKTNIISFPAKVTASTTGVTTEAKFSIDRTKWGMTIYSDPTQQLYILPTVKMHLTVYAAKQP